MNIFDVKLNEKVVGSAEILKRGLYYQISCRCNIPAEKLYRLQAVCDQETVDLGICVPFEDGFGVNKTIAAKKLDTDTIFFHLSANMEESDVVFVPLDTTKPFDNLENIMHAKLVWRDGGAGFLFEKN